MRIYLLLLTYLFLGTIHAQEKKGFSFGARLHRGPNIGFGLGLTIPVKSNNTIYTELSRVISYFDKRKSSFTESITNMDFVYQFKPLNHKRKPMQWIVGSGISIARYKSFYDDYWGHSAWYPKESVLLKTALPAYVLDEGIHLGPNIHNTLRIKMSKNWHFDTKFIATAYKFGRFLDYEDWALSLVLQSGFTYAFD
jgi:hypothetical protein